MGYEAPNRERISQGLKALVSGRTNTWYEPGFFNPTPIAGALEKVRESLEATGSASSIYRTLDVPLYEAAGNADKLNALLSDGLRRESDCDLLFYPFISPGALWWRMMDETWPMGVVRLSCDERRLPFGLFRLWVQGKEALPHQDVLRRELPDHPLARALTRQFGINLYLLNGKGGDLEVWDRRVSDSEWQALGLPGSYGYSRGELGLPQHVFSPVAGDMAMIDTECVHAVTPVVEGARLTLSGFVGYIDDQSPLVCWS